MNYTIDPKKYDNIVYTEVSEKPARIEHDQEFSSKFYNVVTPDAHIVDISHDSFSKFHNLGMNTNDE